MDLNAVLQLIKACCVATVHWIIAVFRFFIPKTKKNIDGEIAFITGAGSGIGQKLSIEFANLGCHVVGCDISEKGLNETKNKLKELGCQSKWTSYVADVTDRQKVYDTATKVASDVGDVSILINNAGVVSGKKFLQCSDEQIIKTMEVNIMAHFWTIKAFLPAMLQKNKGHIVTIASAAGLFGIPGLVDYCASKYAAVGLAEALHMELAYTKNTGVKSTVVCPYYIDTGMFEGISSSFLSLIKVDNAVTQIMDAVLREKSMLMLPRILYLFYGLRGALPERCGYVLGKAFGIYQAMDTFIGRKKKN